MFCLFLTFASYLNASIESLDEKKIKFKENYQNWLIKNKFAIELYHPELQKIISRLYLTSISDPIDENDFVCSQAFIDLIYKDIINIDYKLYLCIRSFLGSKATLEMKKKLTDKILQACKQAVDSPTTQLDDQSLDNPNLLALFKVYKDFDDKCKKLIMI